MNVLAISHCLTGKNRTFEDYCAGVEANCASLTYIDYFCKYTELGKSGFEEYVLETISINRIDCTIIMPWSGDLTFDIKFIEEISRRTALIFFFFDTEYFFEPVDRYYAQVADLVVLPDFLIKFRYELLNIKALCTFPLFDMNYYRNEMSQSKSLDVSFVGNLLQADRKEYVGYLETREIPIVAFGNGTKNGFVDFPEMIRIFNNSKINLNFTGTFNRDSFIMDISVVNRHIRQSKGRPVEIALSGGFVLSEYAPGIEQMFEIGKEIEVFHTKEELLEKINYYLIHDNEREEIARNGHLRAVSNYDCREGIRKVFESIQRKDNKIVYIDNHFMANYCNFHYLYLAIFILRGRLSFAFEEMQQIIGCRKTSVRKAFAYFLKAIVVHAEENPGFMKYLKKLRKLIPIKLRY